MAQRFRSYLFKRTATLLPVFSSLDGSLCAVSVPACPGGESASKKQPPPSHRQINDPEVSMTKQAGVPEIP